ncbi:Hypothetical protein PBC10988_19870 [Planctomycetales bacterium 10988]|nr:Hypothetical protein PBC10988_19870 [Planctomycetales bacterium 10988]
MRYTRRDWLRFSLGLGAGSLLQMSMPGSWLRQASARRPQLSSQPQAGHEVAELFAAMEADELEAKFIPKDVKEARLILTNKTPRPMSVQLPDAFAGVPVLAQFDDDFGGGGGGGGSQSGGGGFDDGGGGGGFFSLPPEKTMDIKVGMVCLEHGKKDPRPAVPYEIKPIETFTQDENLIELLRMYATGRISYSIAQATAWHFSDGMSWQELAAKTIKRLNGFHEPYFNPQEIRLAMQLAHVAKQRAEERKNHLPEEAPAPYLYR